MSSATAGTKENVRVVVRAKPVDPEQASSSVNATGGIHLDSEKGSVYRHGVTASGANELRHDFDGVFDDGSADLCTMTPAAKQNVFFQQHVRPLVDRAITQNLNLTIFAYGETSSGKTHTMDAAVGEPFPPPVSTTTTATGAAVGDTGGSTTPNSCGEPHAESNNNLVEREEKVEGIISMSMRRCVNVLEPAAPSSSAATANVTNKESGASAAAAAAAATSSASSSGGGGGVIWMRLAVKFVEIYNEKLVDLLAAAVAPRRSDDSERLLRMRLRRREDGEDIFFVENLLCFECDSVADAMQWYRRGAQQKTFRAHKMNAHSSRSHCIFTMIVTVCTRGEDGVSLNRRSFEMNFVDLAGSERPDRIAVDDTNVNMRQRAKAQHQAQTLFSESLHINGSLSTLGRVITSLSKGSAHAPYRESKLTSLLRHTLGSSGLLLFVACVAVNNVPETIRTLVFASQARTIRVVAKPVQDANTVLIQQLRARIKELELDLSTALAMNAAQEERPAPEGQQSQHQQQARQTPSTTNNNSSNLNLVSESVLEEVSESAPGERQQATNKEALLSQSLFTACTKVQELMRSNTTLRTQMDHMKRDQDTVSERLSELERENLNLREKLDIMSSVVTLEAKSTQEELLRAAIHGNYSSSGSAAAAAPPAAAAAPIMTSTGLYAYQTSSAIYAAAAPSQISSRSASNNKGTKNKKKKTGSSSSSAAASPSVKASQQQQQQQQQQYDNRYVASHPLLIPTGGGGGGGGRPSSSARKGSAGHQPQQQHQQRFTPSKISTAENDVDQKKPPATGFTVTTRSSKEQQQQQQQQLPPLSNGTSPGTNKFAPPKYIVGSARGSSGNQQQHQNVVGLPLSLYGISGV